ncbi:hypothetical protein DFH09DRAFT_1145152, partial [Mycena vulgaris]
AASATHVPLGVLIHNFLLATDVVELSCSKHPEEVVARRRDCHLLSRRGCVGKRRRNRGSVPRDITVIVRREPRKVVGVHSGVIRAYLEHPLVIGARQWRSGLVRVHPMSISRVILVVHKLQFGVSVGWVEVVFHSGLSVVCTSNTIYKYRSNINFRFFRGFCIANGQRADAFSPERFEVCCQRP